MQDLPDMEPLVAMLKLKLGAHGEAVQCCISTTLPRNRVELMHAVC